MNKWIKTSEKLPEYTCRAGNEYFNHVLVVINGEVWPAMYCNEKWEVMGSVPVKPELVTHWMPYPDPPKD